MKNDNKKMSKQNRKIVRTQNDTRKKTVNGKEIGQRKKQKKTMKGKKITKNALNALLKKKEKGLPASNRKRRCSSGAPGRPENWQWSSLRKTKNKKVYEYTQLVCAYPKLMSPTIKTCHDIITFFVRVGGHFVRI